MAQGFVYLLTSVNSAHVKVGGTENPPTVRIREINGTAAYSALGPWQLSDFRHVHDWRLAESRLHQQFCSQRVGDVDGTRELFAIAASEARQALAALPRDLLVRADEIDRMFQDVRASSGKSESISKNLHVGERPSRSSLPSGSSASY